MKVRAAVPDFLPVEEIRRRAGALLPGIDVVPAPTAPGRYPLEEVEVLILTTFHALPAEEVARMPALRFVQVASTGYDRVDLAACRARGIAVSNVPVANARTVAEHVILLTLALQRDLLLVDRELRAGRWTMATGASELHGKVFGIVGMGRIGRELAARLVPFGTTTLYDDLHPLDPERERALGLERVPLDDLLVRSDIVSLHLPLSDGTRGMLDARRIARMKPGAVLVNTARAELVDAAALREAVTSGRLRAGLDVFPTEPPDFSDPIFRSGNAVFTPHLAGVTREAQARFLEETVTNVLRFVRGEAPRYRVDGGGETG